MGDGGVERTLLEEICTMIGSGKDDEARIGNINDNIIMFCACFVS